MFLNLKNKLKKYCVINKRYIFVTIAIITVFFLSSESTFAAEDKAADYTLMVDWILKFLSAALAVLTYLTTLFLDPAWISWSLFWLDIYFKQIWILVSNLVYFVFAFILIWIAFMNIIWKWDDTYQLKKALPKFVIWILIVPFTWFIIRFVLSMSALLTMAALTLPANTFPEFQSRLDEVMIPNNCSIDFGSGTWTLKWKTNTDWFFECEETEIALWDLTKWNWWNSSVFWVIATYTYWIISIDKLDELNIDEISWGLKTVADLLFKLWFDLVFIVVYWILMITLWLALATRWIYLWIYTIISPVFWLMFFFWKKDWWWEWFIKNFSVTEFIALAMVPVYTMLALSFWLLFIFVIWNWMSEWQASINTGWTSFVELTKEWIEIWDWGQKFTLNIQWSLLWSTDADKKAISLLSEVWSESLWAVWTMIIQLFSIVVLWMAVMAALGASKITAAVTQPIKDFWWQVWWLITKMPTYAPVFPGGQSMSSMWQIARTWTNYFSNKQSDRANDFMKDTWLFWKGNSLKVTSQSEKMSRQFETDKNKLTTEWYNALRDTINSAEDYKDLYWNSSFISSLQKALETAKLSSFSAEFKDFKVEDVKVNDPKKTAELLQIFDKLWERDKKLWDLFTNFTSSKGWTLKPWDIEAFYKNKEWGTPISSSSSWTQNATANNVNEIKISNTIVNNSVVQVWNDEFTLKGYDKDNQVISTDNLVNSIKANEWYENVEWIKFKDLMEKLGIKEAQIKEVKKALKIEEPEPEPETTP